jgi:predicted GIY-YIG superfamily endonuclease
MALVIWKNEKERKQVYAACGGDDNELISTKPKMYLLHLTNDDVYTGKGTCMNTRWVSHLTADGSSHTTKSSQPVRIILVVTGFETAGEALSCESAVKHMPLDSSITEDKKIKKAAKAACARAQIPKTKVFNVYRVLSRNKHTKPSQPICHKRKYTIHFLDSQYEPVLDAENTQIVLPNVKQRRATPEEIACITTLTANEYNRYSNRRGEKARDAVIYDSSLCLTFS